VSLHPLAQEVASGSTATFVAAAEGIPTPTVQWEVNDGTGWTQIPGATDLSYTTPATTASMNGWQYRAEFTNEFDYATSDAALLTVTVQPVTIAAPSVTFGAGKARRTATFEAAVTPVAAASALDFTLHLLHWETRRVDGVKVTDWFEYPSVALSVSDAAQGTIGGSAVLPSRGEWKAYVTSPAGSGYEAGTSPERLFTVK
jgi:hypothetical protein